MNGVLSFRTSQIFLMGVGGAGGGRVGGSGPHMAVLSASPQLYAQGPLLAGLGVFMGSWGLKVDQPRARPVLIHWTISVQPANIPRSYLSWATPKLK